MSVTNNYLLVKTINPKDTTAGGVILADKAIDVARWGRVLSIGEGLSDLQGNYAKPDFNEGDLVYFARSAPEKMDYTAEGIGVLHLISEGDVLLKVTMLADGKASMLPMGNYVHVEQIEEDKSKVTAGGIILPDQQVEKPTKGKVIAIGPGQRTMGKYFPVPLAVGDIVRYRKYCTLQISFADLGIPDTKSTLVGYGDIVMVETDEFLTSLKEKINERTN